MSENRPRLIELLNERVVFFDGAMGTSIHALDLPLSDYRNLENCVEVLNLSRPDAIQRIHGEFYDAGCDVVETNTFGGMKHVLAEFGLDAQCREINIAAARIARRAADAASSTGRPRFVAGSMGPGTKLITLRQISYDLLLDSYLEQAIGLLEGGVDCLVIETCQDILQTKTVIEACRRAMQRAGRRVPIIAQVTVETTGTMLVGTDIAAALTAIEAYSEVDVIGMNCATGPQEMSEHIRYLSRTATRKLSVQPNAGLPQVVDGRAHFPLTPTELAKWLAEFVAQDGVNIVGGCCGTTPAHLKTVVDAIGLRAPAARRPAPEPSCSSLYQAVPYRQDNSFLIVGERCNTNGSKKFKELLAADDVDGCVHMAVEQVKEEGAHVLDVCVDYVGREGAPDMQKVVDRFAREVTAPLMLDSTQLDVLEAGLKLAGGKCIINSVNLEDGEEKLARVAGLCRQYGAAVVALTIDEDPVEAMAKTADRKLAIAERLHSLLVGKHGLREEDIFWDCLTFPITTGNEADRRLGLETLDGIERIMRRYPRSQSILGLSNISFGLLPVARVVLNSVFLHEARSRGLTAAIVHAGKILPENQIAPERWQAALDLIYDRTEQGAGSREQGAENAEQVGPLERFISLFSADEKLGEKSKLTDLPVEERLRRRIVDGAKLGLDADISEALTRYKPLEIVNTFLLDGMKIVGELFGAGQMQLPFVLKSAETMKAAVALLEPHMERVAGSSRGKIVLATVRGDVHDIGKNLVDIILTNNGYTVYNLGIKQPISNVLTALREHGADAIGLSGLLVKSTLVMRDDLLVLGEQQIRVPVILGGAALTRRYVEEDLRPLYAGPLHYAKDAFEGLRLMERICSPAEALVGVGVGSEPGRSSPSGAPPAAAEPPSSADTRKLTLDAEQRYGIAGVGDTEEDDDAAAAQPPADSPAVAARAKPGITHESPVPTPPFWGSRIVAEIPLKAALGYLNEVMLFQVQWGFRKRGRSKDEFKRYIDAEVRPIYRELVQRCDSEKILQCAAVYGYWPACSDGDDLIIYEPPTPSRAQGVEGPRGQGSAGAGQRDGAHLPSTPRPLDPLTPASLRELTRFTFPRQRKAPHWCLSDFWRPVSAGVADVAAFHIVTAGRRVSEVAREWFARNDYQQYLFLHGLGVETAEALAEYMHKQIRMELGVAGSDEREITKLFQQGYQGSRYSFGYPACPRLEDQTLLMKLLEPERIGIVLSEGYQLEPEQSTSAIITYHPDARYFNVR